MRTLIVGVVLVPLLDHVVKRIVRARVSSGTISLGVMGQIGVVQTHIWMLRASRGVTPYGMWTCWVVAASALATIAAVAPSFGWCSGLLRGGALSHAVETSWRGAIHDYVRLRFWPAFDLADVALTVVAMGMAIEAYVVWS